MMPEMSGIELHGQVAELAPEYLPRMVFITGGAFTDEARTFLASVENPHLEKPFTEPMLRRAIDAVATPAQAEPVRGA
jgi:CheY-like chemotaxis protein